MSKSESKAKVPNPNGCKGKPLSLYPLTVEEALRRALRADPAKVKQAEGRPKR